MPKERISLTSEIFGGGHNSLNHGLHSPQNNKKGVSGTAGNA